MILWANLDKEQRLEIIKREWENGLSAGQIAELFVGATKNGVIGYVHRAGLRRSDPAATKAASIRHRTRMEREAKAKANRPLKPAKKPQPRPNNFAGINAAKRAARKQLMIVGGGAVMEKAEAAPSPYTGRNDAFSPLPNVDPVPFMERRSLQCRWPVGGEGADMLCCGALASKGRYCKPHTKMAVQAAGSTKRMDERLGITEGAKKRRWAA